MTLRDLAVNRVERRPNIEIKDDILELNRTCQASDFIVALFRNFCLFYYSKCYNEFLRTSSCIHFVPRLQSETGTLEKINNPLKVLDLSPQEEIQIDSYIF